MAGSDPLPRLRDALAASINIVAVRVANEIGPKAVIDFARSAGITSKLDPHLAIALAIKACQHGHRVAFATAQQWVDRLDAAQHRNALDDELRRLERYELMVVDEIGYLPLERQAANLLFALIARRYERGSIIVTSNRGFEAWGEILSDAMVAAALIDRLVHHAHIVTLRGKSYRLKERGGAPTPNRRAIPQTELS